MYILQQNSETCTFFDGLAENWDSICFHDPSKILNCLAMSGIKDAGAGAKIIDVGTGTGVLIPFIKHFEMAGKTFTIDAVDASAAMLEKARKKLAQYDRINFINCDFLDEGCELHSKKKQNSYDYIFMYCVLPHFPDFKTVFRAAYNLLSKNGRMVIFHSEPKEAINNMHEKSCDDEYEILPDAAILTKIIEKNGFEVVNYIDNKNCFLITAEIRQVN